MSSFRYQLSAHLKALKSALEAMNRVACAVTRSGAQHPECIQKLAEQIGIRTAELDKVFPTLSLAPSIRQHGRKRGRSRRGEPALKTAGSNHMAGRQASCFYLEFGSEESTRLPYMCAAITGIFFCASYQQANRLQL